MANVKPFTKGQQAKVERMISEALDALDIAHREELRRRANQYQTQADEIFGQSQKYLDRIDDLQGLVKSMAKELSRR